MLSENETILLKKGAKALSTSKLLAILLGEPGDSKLLDVHGSLQQLFRATPKTGLTPQTYTKIQAWQTLQQRYLLERLHHQPIFKKRHDLHQYLISQLQPYRHEVFAVILLDQQNRLLAFNKMTEGHHYATVVEPRKIIELCLTYCAHGVILAHNHPSGSMQASKADERVTKALQKALRWIDVMVVDHLIVAGNRVVSLMGVGG